MRSLIVLAALTAPAAADPDFAKCADTEIATLPDGPTKTRLVRELHGDTAADLDAREQKALADTRDPIDGLEGVSQDAADLKDSARLVHLADIAETTAKSLVAPSYEPDLIPREAKLAMIQARAGHSREARVHLEAGLALLAKQNNPPADRDLWTAALVLNDPVLVTKTEKLYWASHNAAADFGPDARLMSYDGVGRAILPHAEKDQRALHLMIEGLESRKDIATIAEVLPKLELRQRIMDLGDVWEKLDSADPRIVAVMKDVLAEDLSALDEVAIRELASTAAPLGFAQQASVLVARLTNPWDRAAHEADVAKALALTDKKAAIAMANSALKRARTKGMRTSASNDESHARDAEIHAAAALTRAGDFAAAKKLVKTLWLGNQLIGARDDAKQLAAIWQAAGHQDRASVLTHVATHDPSYGDASYLAPLCP